MDYIDKQYNLFLFYMYMSFSHTHTLPEYSVKVFDVAVFFKHSRYCTIAHRHPEIPTVDNCTLHVDTLYLYTLNII